MSEEQKTIKGGLAVVIKPAKEDPDYLIGPGCTGCIYLGRIGYWPCCDYLWRTGHLRPDGPISSCTVRVGKPRKPSPEGYYYKDEVLRTLNIATSTLSGYMAADGIRAVKIKGYGQAGLLTEAQVIEIAGRHMSYIRSDTALPGDLGDLRRKAIRAIKAHKK